MSAPSSFFCPLSGYLMTDPVIAADGRTYQRSSIQSERHLTDLGGESQPEIQEVVPNEELSAEIEKWEECYLTNLPRDMFSLNGVSPDPCRCQTHASGELHFSGAPAPCPVLVLKIPSDRIQRSSADLLRLGRHPYLARIRGICDDGNETLLASENPFHGPLLDAIFKLKEQNSQAVSWNHRICMIQQICVALNFLEQTQSTHDFLSSKNVQLFRFCENDPERTVVKLSGYAARPCSHESINRLSQMGQSTILKEQPKEATRVMMFGILALRILSLGTLDTVITSDLEGGELCESFSSLFSEERMPHGCPVTMLMALKECLRKDQSQRPSFSQLSEKLLREEVEGRSSPTSFGMLKIAVKSLTGNFSFIEVKPQANILKVKKVIQDKLGINPEQQRLIYNGKELDDSQSLHLCGCHSGSVLHLVLRLRCIAAMHPASFGHYKCVIDDDCLVDVESRKIMDEERLHELVRRNCGSLKLMPTLSKVRLLPSHSCMSLIKYLNGYSKVFPWETDLNLPLGRHELKDIIGEQNVRVLEKYFDTSYDLIRVRRTVASDNWIPFHLDDSRRTMQVALNSEDEYEGGRVVFATGEGLVEPARQAGFGTTHSSFLVHGVTRLQYGVRYALFLCDMYGHYERKTISYLLNYLRKQLKFFEVAIEFLRGLNDEDISEYVHQYSHFIKHKRTEVPSFGVELVWRCHMLSPVGYKEFCQTLKGQDTDGALVDHVPGDPQRYCLQKPIVSSARSGLGINAHLVASVRAQHGFMKHALSTILIEDSSQHFAEAVGDYYEFLRQVRDKNTTAVPSVTVDFVWHTHMLFPLRYEKECHLIVGRLVDHRIA